MNEHELQIPAPYNQYYEFSPNEVNFDELPDAFDHYKELKVVAELYAKEQYEDALADNCLDFCWLVEDEAGKLLLVTTVALRVYQITLEEIDACIDGNVSYDDYDMTGSWTLPENQLTESALRESISTFKDLYSYRYQFKVISKSEPNSTFSDDMLRHAEEFGCVKIYYPLDLPSRQLRFLYICKDESSYDKLQKFLSTSSTLKNMFKLTSLAPFDASEVEQNLRSIYRKDLTKLQSNTTGARRSGQPNTRTYKEPSVAFFVDDYSSGSIRIPLTDIVNESVIKKFQPGDVVYVSVANRRGRVRKMISSDVVEVELDDNGLYPARIDRYYTDGVELIFSDDDLDDDIEGLTFVEIEHPQGSVRGDAVGYMTEEFTDVCELRYKYISDDDSDYYKLVSQGTMTQEEINNAYDNEEFPDIMWLDGSARITQEEGYDGYQVSFGMWDDYADYETIEECKEHVERFHYAVRWID